AGDHPVDQAPRVRPGDHVLVQRGEVDDGEGLADRVVLDVVEVRVDLGREIAGPLAPRELLVEPRRARVERGTDGHATTSEWKGTACSVGADPAGETGWRSATTPSSSAAATTAS